MSILLDIEKANSILQEIGDIFNREKLSHSDKTFIMAHLQACVISSSLEYWYDKKMKEKKPKKSKQKKENK